MKLLLRPSCEGQAHVAVGVLVVSDTGIKSLAGVLCFRADEWAELRPLIEDTARRSEIEVEFQQPAPLSQDWQAWERRAT